MEFWVDGYNLMLRRLGGRKAASLADERRALVVSLGTIGRPIRVFFDAARTPGGISEKLDGPRVTVVFARAESADDAMIHALRQGNPKDVTLVTNDRELRRRAHQLGATTLGVEKFEKDITDAAAPKAQPKKPQDNEGRIGDVLNRMPMDTDYWMKEMGLQGDWTPETEEPPSP